MKNKILNSVKIARGQKTCGWFKEVEKRACGFTILTNTI